MRNYYILFLSIFIIGLFLGYLSLPTKYSLGMLYLQSGLYSQAIKLFEEHSKEEKIASADLAIALAQSYFSKGKTKKATSILKDFLKKYPHSISVREQLGYIYLQQERIADYIENLRIISEQKPNEKTFDYLISGYTSLGNYNLMYKVLADKYKYNPSSLSQKEYYSLIYVYTSKQDKEKLFSVINNYRSFYADSMNSDNVQLIIHVYYQYKEADKAFDIAKKDIQNKSTTLVNKIRTLNSITNYNSVSALKLISLLSLNDRKNSRIILLELQNELNLNRSEKAYKKVLSLLDKNKITPILLEASIYILLLKHDFSSLKELLHKKNINNISVSTLTDIAIYSLFFKQQQLADYLMINIQKPIINNVSILKKLLTSCIKNLSPKTTVNNIIEKNYEVNYRQRLLMADLLYNSGYKNIAFRLLKKFTVEVLAISLSSSIVVNYAIAEKCTEQFTSELNTLCTEHNWRVNKFLSCYLDILAATGKTEKLASVLNKLNDIKALEIYLKNSFSTAEQYNSKKTALFLSEKMYNMNKRPPFTQYYINSLIINSRFQKALDIILLPENNPLEYFNEYTTAFYGLVKNKDEKNINKYKSSLIKLYNKSIDNKKLDNEQLSSLGYILAETGLTKRARDIFFKLSYYAPPDSPYVKQLIYLWGKQDWKEGLDWLIMRAKTATKIEQLKWLKYLNETDNPKPVISILRQEGTF